MHASWELSVLIIINVKSIEATEGSVFFFALTNSSIASLSLPATSLLALAEDAVEKLARSY